MDMLTIIFVLVVIALLVGGFYFMRPGKPQ
jgi:flagellar motor component MotA